MTRILLVPAPGDPHGLLKGTPTAWVTRPTRNARATSDTDLGLVLEDCAHVAGIVNAVRVADGYPPRRLPDAWDGSTAEALACDVETMGLGIAVVASLASLVME